MTGEIESFGPGRALATGRIDMIDAARFYGIALVFYGHFVERIMYLGNPAAAAQYKFIYSFHMVLFFVLSGYVSKRRDMGFSPGRFLLHRSLSRLVPFIFFNLFMAVLAAFIPGYFFDLDLPSVKGYLGAGLMTAFGLPLLNVPTWFLLCLFSVELLHYLFGRFIPRTWGRLVAALVIYLAGYYFNLYVHVFDISAGKVVWRNFLYIHEAVVMYAFFLAGVFLREIGLAKAPGSWGRNAGLAAGLLLLVFLTFGLNQGPFRIFDAVVIMVSGHGNILLFPLTALAGSIMVMFAARATLDRFPGLMPTLVFLGKNGLVLFCLNGLFYHFVNGPVAALFGKYAPQAGWSVLLVSLVVTLLSLAVCYPLVRLFSHWVPQLVGRPSVKGPLLPAFIKPSSSA